MEEQVKFYKANAIYIMTILFGPCAGGWMMGVNFFHMGKKRAGWLTIILSGVLMAAVMLAILLLPERANNAIPNLAIPAIFGGIAYLIVDKTQRMILREAAEKEAGFYSIWKSLGVGFLGGLVTLAIALAVVLPPMLSLQKKWDEMLQYEEKALKLEDWLDLGLSDAEIAAFVRTVGLVNWDKFSAVVEEISNSPGITKDELIEIKWLREYVRLRKLEYQCILDMTGNKMDREEDLIKYKVEINEVLNKLSTR